MIAANSLPPELPNAMPLVVTNPWITSGLIKSVTHKNKLYSDWKKSITNREKNGSSVKFMAYKSYQKRLKLIIRSAKKNHYYKVFDKK